MIRRLLFALAVVAVLATSGIYVESVAAAGCYFHSADVGYVCDAEPVESAFVQPQPFPDSFLERASYAKLHDNINVYASYSVASGVVRNVGDGFLYATIQAHKVLNDESWYMINFNEWVRAEDLTLASASDFTGFEITAQPERPFGWMIVDYWYSNAPGVDHELGNLKLPRYTFFEVFDAVEDSEGWLWYDIGNGRWMKQTYVSLVDPHPAPEEVGPNGYWVEVDLYEQSFAAYEGDRMVYAGLVSSGLNRWPTGEGLFQVWDRQSTTKMSGAEGKVDYYYIEDVPHTMFFDGDIALHGAFWHDRFGYKHSHGCVNMPPRAAEWVFNWSENAPADLWVWVHTSDPQHYFDQYGLDAAVASN